MRMKRDFHGLIFLHLAKTAGATLGAVLARNYRQEEQLPVVRTATPSALGTWAAPDVAHALAQRPIAIVGQPRLIAGHLGFGVHCVTQTTYRYITMVREPVDRLLSGFYYSIPRHIEQTGEDLSLEDYVLRKRHYDLGLDNYQTRVLSGDPTLDPSPPVTTATGRSIDETDFTAVQSVLEREFLLIGVTDRFDESLVVLAGLMGWPLHRQVYRRTNVTPNRPTTAEIPHHLRQAIARRNEYDERLYRLAQRQLDHQIARLEPGFTHDLALFRTLNALHAAGASEDALVAYETRKRKRLRWRIFR